MGGSFIMQQIHIFHVYQLINIKAVMANLNYLPLYYLSHFFYGVGYYIIGPYVPYLAE